MKILVCGATGFVGRNIFESFSGRQGYETFGLVLNRSLNYSRIYGFDLTLTNNKEIDSFFSKNKFDVVIQCAAASSGIDDTINKPYLHVTDNAVMNSLLLKKCFENNVRHFIFPSCGVMYNPAKSPVSEEDFNESDGIVPTYFGVGWTKVYIEKMCEFYSRLGRTKHTVMRLSNTYGPYDKFDLERSHFMGANITKVMKANEGDDIVVCGDGSTERDLIYIDDVVDFIDDVIQRQTKLFDIFNVSYGKSFSVSEIVQKIIDYSGKDLKIKYDISKPFVATKLAMKNDKAFNDIDWQPKISIDKGIKETLRWYKKNVF